jgi:Tfp pilus assembly protein PilZ
MTTSDKLGQPKERRKDARHKCRTSVQYAVQDSNYTTFIQDISYGGGFIESPASINVGETITMYVQYAEGQDPIAMIGEVVRVSPQGFGVRFKMGIDASLMKHITEE